MIDTQQSPKKKYEKNVNVNVQVFISWHLIFWTIYLYYLIKHYLTNNGMAYPPLININPWLHLCSVEQRIYKDDTVHYKKFKERNTDCTTKVMKWKISCRKFNEHSTNLLVRGCRGHDRMVVEFTTNCAISAYHH